MTSMQTPIDEVGETEVDRIPPDDIGAIVTEIVGTDRTVTREKQVGRIFFEFQFRAFSDEQAVFLSGRDITRRRELEIRHGLRRTGG